MTQETQGVQSTKPADDDHVHLTIRQDKIITYVLVDCLPITSKLYNDSTGRFWTTFTSGNKCNLVVYDYDSNAIHEQDMASGTK